MPGGGFLKFKVQDEFPEANRIALLWNAFFETKSAGGGSVRMIRAFFGTNNLDSISESDAVACTFRWLGEHCTIPLTKPQTELHLHAARPEGLAAAVAASTVDGLADKANHLYHSHLISATISTESTQSTINDMIDLQLKAGRRMHAADLVALLVEYPNAAINGLYINTVTHQTRTPSYCTGMYENRPVFVTMHKSVELSNFL